MTFEDLEAYYDYLENETSLLFDYNISNSLLNLRDIIENDDLKKHCSYEIYFNDYSIRNGEIKPKISTADNTYPHFDLFEDDLNYIKIRAANTVNPKYKAKYNHLLWNSKHKNHSFAKLAIDSYFTFLKSVSFSLSDNLSHHSFEIHFQNLFILSQSSNYKKAEALQFLVLIIGNRKINGYKEYSLMKFVVENGKKIDKIILQGFYDYSNKVIDNLHYPDLLEKYIELQILLCPKNGTNSKPFHIKLAEYYIAKTDDQKESFVNHDYYLKALEEYQKAGEKGKIEEVTVLLEKAKKNINFKLSKVEYTDELLQNYWESLIKKTDILVEKSDSWGIYTYLIVENIFPKAEVLNQEVRPVMFDLVNVQTFDINNNIDKKAKSGIRPYFIHIQNFSIQHLRLIFSKGLKNGKVSYESLLDFLKQNTWYGNNFKYVNADGELEGFDWIELLSPSLFSFFTQSEIDIKQNINNSTGYIIPTDSLVLKFEGLLREFSRYIGAQTIELKENGTQERISFEKLLENEKLKSIIPEDDIALFKFLFTSDGMNLRNNIAHCFYKTSSYSAGTMFLLITALLRLGKYDLSSQ